jgi:phosphoesterase RecJ-like protein
LELVFIPEFLQSGSFRFPGTTGNTHRIVSELIDLGVENTKIPSLLFENSSYSRLQLLGRALQNLKVLSNHQTSYTTLTQDELNSFDFIKAILKES